MSVADQEEEYRTSSLGSSDFVPMYTRPEWAQTDDEHGSQGIHSEESISHGFLTISDLTDVSIATPETHQMGSASSDKHAINSDVLSHTSSTQPPTRGKKTRRFEDIPEQTPPPLKGPVILATFGSYGEVLWSAEDVISGYPGTGPMSPGERYLESEGGGRRERSRGVINYHNHLARLQNDMREMRKRKVLANSNSARELIAMERRVAELKAENENLKGRIFELGQRIP
ncbi:hypothetical protein KEM56_007105 [Ascosphaera pollenicola]|nr:hypothetical protein KEM56_007105 [Ascosphaera pollenicola]